MVPQNSFFPLTFPLFPLWSSNAFFKDFFLSFFRKSLNWLMYEQSGAVNTEHKTWTLSNSGFKIGIWGLWPWFQNSSVDLQLFLPRFSQIFSSHNPGTAVPVLSPLAGTTACGVIRHPLHRCLDEVTHASLEPENIRSRGEPREASWHGCFEFEAIAAWLQESLDSSQRRRWQMRIRDKVSIMQRSLLWLFGLLAGSLKVKVWLQILTGRMGGATGLGLPVSSPLDFHYDCSVMTPNCTTILQH